VNSNLSSTLSDFSKGRRPSESSNERPSKPTKLNLATRARSLLDKLLSWFRKLVRLAFVRYLIAFVIGITATLAWQSYGRGAREAVAGWSPHLRWLAPPAAPVQVSADHRKATAAALAEMRRTVDRLATEITNMQAIEQGPSDRTSPRPPSRPGSRRL